jgi:hypothetical protein
LAVDDEHKFIVAVRLDLTQMLDLVRRPRPNLGYVAACR